MFPMKEELIVEKKLKGFYSFLDSTSLLPIDKKNIMFMIEYFQGNVPKKFASNSCLISGDPGMGKTYLVEELLNVFNVPILYTGPSHIKKSNIIKFDGIESLSKGMGKHDNFIVFLDDLNVLLDFGETGEICIEHKLAFMDILEKTKKTEKKIIIVMTANDSYRLDEAMLDRIELKIEMDAPSEANKLDFLRKTYDGMLKENEVRHLVKNCIGYNFRDLPEVVKIAFREGDKKISIASINKALKHYKPTNMSKFDVINNVNLRFKDVVGKDRVKRIIGRVMLSAKRKDLCRKLGMRRSNLLIFHGPPGTGKTYFAKALAGELGYPIVKVNALSFSSHGYFNSMYKLSKIANRFGNSILFIDEADKLLARSALGEDNTEQSYLNEMFDGIDNSINGLVILSLNDLYRFSNGFLDRFCCIKFEKPDFNERLEFIRSKIAESGINPSFDVADAARITDGMSFRDIEKLWNELMFDFLENKKVDGSLVRQIAREIRQEEESIDIYG